VLDAVILLWRRGEPGEYTAKSAASAPVIGYSNLSWSSPLEASPTMRGLRGNPGSSIWWNYVLWSAGRQMCLSLTTLQRTADGAGQSRWRLV
jgi:hypothetical protein